jgi:hypothetical protein
MGEKFTYSHKFKASKEEVFQQISSWLKKEGAQITMDKRPDKVEAIQGSMKALKVWNVTAEKRISFTLSEDSEGVNVVLVMEPASKMFEDDVYAWRNKIQTAWGQLANDIWTSVDQSIAH